ITERQIVAFFLGTAIGSLITYWYLTRDKRTIDAIRRDVDLLGVYHELSDAQYREAQYPTKLVTDEQILVLQRWSAQACHRLKNEQKISLSAVRLTAEIIICEELLGLTRFDAFRALISGIKERGTLTDIRKRLPKEPTNGSGG